MLYVFVLDWLKKHKEHRGRFSVSFLHSYRLNNRHQIHNINDQVYSQCLVNTGYTEMGLFNRMQYFLVVPDAADKDLALLNGIDYPQFFKLLSDKI